MEEELSNFWAECIRISSIVPMGHCMSTTNSSWVEVQGSTLVWKNAVEWSTEPVTIRVQAHPHDPTPLPSHVILVYGSDLVQLCSSESVDGQCGATAPALPRTSKAQQVLPRAQEPRQGIPLQAITEEDD